MAVGMLTGCGTKDVDTTNDKAVSNSYTDIVNTKEDDNTVNVTRRLEKKYIERIEAYQEYYEQVRSNYSNYVIGGMVTLDSDGLPLFWLGLSQDGSKDNYRTQLIGYENDEVVIMAERSEYIVPYRSSKLIMASGRTDGAEDNYYLYDDEKKDFRIINSELDALRNNETVYSEKELEETMNFLIPVIESMTFYNSIQIATNESARQIAYLGKANIDVNYKALSYMNVTSNIYVDSDILVGCYLREEYGDNKVALECFEKLPDVDLEGSSIEGYVNKYSDIVKESNELFTTATGTVLSATEYRNSVNIIEETEWEISSGGSHLNGMAYFTDAELGQLLRGLTNNPLYSEEELYIYIASLAFNYEIVDIAVESYTLLDASDNYIAKVVESYFSGRSYCESNFTDELINERNAILETEPYNIISENRRYSCNYENNIATIELWDSDVQYQFQIEFTEVRDKISKITYIDPMASMSEEEKQAYKVKTEVLPAYEKYLYENPMSTSEKPYSLIFMNDDTIPEVVIQGDCEATGNMICTYIDNEVVSMYTSRLMFSFLEKQNLLNNCGGIMGSYYDRIFSIKDRAFECVYSGEWMESYDYDEGHVITDENGNVLYEYLWGGQQVSSDEYNNSLAQVYDDDKAIWNYDLSYYSSIQEAYDNIGNSSAVEVSEQESTTETYHDVMYSCDVFELKNQRLQINAENFSIDLEISSDCVWQTRYTDGSVYDSSYEDLQRSWKNALDSKQKLDEMGREYESPEGLGVEVKDGKVVAVYMTAS